MNSILRCNVWCADNDQAEILGIESGDCWMPISIKWSAITSIKEAGRNDFLGTGKATIHISEHHFIIDLPYEDAVQMWNDFLLGIK